MARSHGRDVIRRFGGNPLIAIDDLPFRACDLWNAGVVRFRDEYLLLLTVETLQGRYSIFRADSREGWHFDIADEPFMAPVEHGADGAHETVGIRDARITKLNGSHYIAYVADGDHGQRLGLAETADFEHVRRLGYVSQVDVKNGVMFPRKIDGAYVMLTRPDAGGSIWLSRSDDLAFWGDDEVVMTPRGGYWDGTRIGAAAPPIEIGQGWLLLYYGEKETSAGPLVRLGAAVLDRANPAKVLARSNIPILTPREKYERVGNVPNVVFSCGALLEDDRLNVYYGASGSCICLGTARLDDLLQACFEGERAF
jgi:predicted GH43/DUF377 family glycosyl hydrolase